MRFSREPRIATTCSGAQASLDAHAVELALGDVRVAGDVRVSVFHELQTGFCAHRAMMEVPNAMRATEPRVFFLLFSSFLERER